MKHGKNDGSYLDIDTLLDKTKDKDIVERRKERLKKLRFTEWRIWDIIGITWK